METKSNYSVVGGIAEVVMYPATALLPEEPTTTLDEDSEGVVVPIDCGASSYNESVESDGAFNTPNNFAVHHRLELQPIGWENPINGIEFAEYFLRGLVFDIKLSSGMTIRMGHSERHGADYPALFTSSKFTSGKTPIDYPLCTLIFESTDQVVLIK